MFRFICSALLIASSGVLAASPHIYHQPANESPVEGAPDDLLLLPGSGLAADSIVVYRRIADTTQSLAAPRRVPDDSTAQTGVATVVSAANAPESITVRLPPEMRVDQSYALWVRNKNGEWSEPVMINDARPLWASPAYVYASSMPASLPRELKIIGRNLQPNTRHATQIRLVGPQRFTGTVVTDLEQTNTLDHYVARVQLPTHLEVGRYRVQVNRDGTSWVDLIGQTIDVLPDLRRASSFSVSDSRFGACRPDDGIDDTSCILRALDAADQAGGGSVYFGPGTWDLTAGNREGRIATDGLVVPAGVELLGGGAQLTRLLRHPEWNGHANTPVFTLLGPTRVSGFKFRDLQVYRSSDQQQPYILLGRHRQDVRADAGSTSRLSVDDVVITHNEFDKPFVAIGDSGLPINRLLITYNIFGAYSSALELIGDKYDTAHPYRIDDTVIAHNVFRPGSKLDTARKTGSIASEIGAGHRFDFSGNTADGASIDYLYAPDDAKGWRAAFFWSTNNNDDEVLISQNTATCTGDKIGDGEAFALDNNINTFAFASAPKVAAASADTVTVSASLASRQHDRDIPVASYYMGHWIQIVGGPGTGQTRKIVGYTTDAMTHLTVFKVTPAWDVVPDPGQTRIAVGREFWQVFVIDNVVDNRQPLCQKSNRSRHVAGSIVMWAQSADSVIAGNRQYDSAGIFVQEAYVVPEHPCVNCTMDGYFQSSLDIRENLIDGEYDWGTNCSTSGITLGVAASPWEPGPPPTLGFGVSIAHNTIRHADAQNGGAIAQLDTWYSGPEPHRWPLSDNAIIHHNAISDIAGSRAKSECGNSYARIGIAFPAPAIAWRTVLYANSCENVPKPLGAGGVETIAVCPSVLNSCECPVAQ